MRRWEDLLQFSAILLGVVLCNQLASRGFFRLDLTEEQRYTISPATKALLRNLDDEIFVQVYLEGELNAGFRRLQKSVRETLDEFRVYAGDRLQYAFIDPNSLGESTQERQRAQQQLLQQGIQATNVVDQEEGQQVQKLVFPAAMVSYGTRQQPVLLLKGNRIATAQERLNQSVEGVEYQLAMAIASLTQQQKKRIAFVEGHDELTALQTADITGSLQEFFRVERIRLDQQPLDDYAALIVAQPKARFSDADKFYLDQYIMRGGRALFLMDMVQMNLDSIALQGTYAFGRDLNIEDQLFRYGAKLDLNLIQALQDQLMGVIQVTTDTFGGQPNVQNFPFPYYVYLNRFAEHPITRNLDAVYARFLSTVDTTREPGIRKTPLMFTSKYTRVKEAPTLVSLEELRVQNELDPSRYDKQYLPAAYLLEGQFKSYFATRFAPPGVRGGAELLRQGTAEAKIIVAADGDLLRNELDPRSGQPLPLGYDRLRQQTFSNTEFIVNALNYLTDEDGLIASRAKQVTLRPLDGPRIQRERLYWQFVNIGLPVLAVVAFGVGRYFFRRWKYEKGVVR